MPVVAPLLVTPLLRVPLLLAPLLLAPLLLAPLLLAPLLLTFVLLPASARAASPAKPAVVLELDLLGAVTPAIDPAPAAGVRLGAGGRVGHRSTLTGEVDALRAGPGRITAFAGPQVAWDPARRPDQGFEIAGGIGLLSDSGLGATGWLGTAWRVPAASGSLFVVTARGRTGRTAEAWGGAVDLAIGLRTRPDRRTRSTRGGDLGTPLQVFAPGYLPATVIADPEDPPEIPLVEAPAQGTLLLVTWPGDRVTVQDRPLADPATARDGVVQATLPEGPATVRVEGGGRSANLETAIVSGHATWLRAPTPPPVRILFPLRSATLPPDVAATLEPLVDLRGDWRYEIIGSASAEGDAALNLSLARMRAQGVLEWLLARQVPPEVLSPRILEVPEADLPPEMQRACVLVPLPASPGDTP